MQRLKLATYYKHAKEIWDEYTEYRPPMSHAKFGGIVYFVKSQGENADPYLRFFVEKMMERQIEKLVIPAGTTPYERLAAVVLHVDVDELDRKFIAANKKAIDHMLRALPEREMKAIRCIYGLDDGKYIGFKKAAEAFGVDESRMKSVHKKAVKNMRLPCRICVFENRQLGSMQIVRGGLSSDSIVPPSAKAHRFGGR